MKKIIAITLLCLIASFAQGYEKPLKPIEVHENQNIFNLISKDTASQRLTSEKKQNQAMRRFFDHYFSPWTHRPHSVKALKKQERNHIHYYRNNLGWGENFHHHNKRWINKIVANINVSKFPNANRKAITVDNAYVRVLPTLEPHFNNFRLAGEGYPFDNLQETVIWADTPVRVLHVSKNGDWAFVQSPAVSGWVQMRDIAYVSKDFVRIWKKSHFVATILNDFPMKDTTGIFRFKAYMGSLFPIVKTKKNQYEILIPLPNLQRQAIIRHVWVSKKQVRKMPLVATPNHFAMLIHELLGTPYGWGNLYFYNDCSGTLKSLFTPFGIWLPRNSTAQGNAGQITILNTLSQYRQKALLRRATPFLTLIHLPGHIMLYVGEHNGDLIIFQNLWAYVTQEKNGVEGRAVIGKAALMKFYPYTNVPLKMVQLL